MRAYESRGSLTPIHLDKLPLLVVMTAEQRRALIDSGEWIPVKPHLPRREGNTMNRQEGTSQPQAAIPTLTSTQELLYSSTAALHETIDLLEKRLSGLLDSDLEANAVACPDPSAFPESISAQRDIDRRVANAAGRIQSILQRLAV